MRASKHNVRAEWLGNSAGTKGTFHLLPWILLLWILSAQSSCMYILLSSDRSKKKYTRHEINVFYLHFAIRNCSECNRIVIDDSLQGVTSSGIFAWSGSLDQRIYLEKGQVFLHHFLVASFWSLRQCYGYVEVQRTHWFLLAEVPTERKNQIRNLFIYCTKIA